MVVVGVRAFYSDYLSLNSAEFCRFILWNFFKKTKINPKKAGKALFEDWLQGSTYSYFASPLTRNRTPSSHEEYSLHYN